MKIAVCLQCDKKMNQLTNLLWCGSCNFVADKRILEETVKCQTWEISELLYATYWYRVKPYERKAPKKIQIRGFRATC